MAKITEEQLKKVVEQNKELEDTVLEIGILESKKHALLHKVADVNKVLEESSYALCFGGRLAVISFHSIEDRIVKRFIQGKDRRHSSINFNYIGDKFIKPSLEEIKKNPRSRSAILRVAEKVV